MRLLTCCLITFLCSSLAMADGLGNTQRFEKADLPRIRSISASIGDIILVIEEVKPADIKSIKGISDGPHVKVRAVEMDRDVCIVITGDQQADAKVGWRYQTKDGKDGGYKDLIVHVLDRRDSRRAWAAKMMHAITVHIQSTHDDKDKEIDFDFVLREGSKETDREIARVSDVGHNQLWPNNDKRDIRFAIPAYPLSDRLKLTLWHYYRNPSGGNQGWEGRIAASADIGGGELALVLAERGDYKLGENDNPKRKSHRFNH